jgi:tetratricopeptide (TPR) repeat protein
LKKASDELFKAQKYEEAIRSYTKLAEQCELNKKFLSILQSNISTCLHKQKKVKEALEYIKKAVRNDPKYAKAFYRKGCYEE